MSLTEEQISNVVDWTFDCPKCGETLYPQPCCGGVAYPCEDCGLVIVVYLDKSQSEQEDDTED